jgi:hypothetical protein
MLTELVRGFSPWGHARFERWCVLAVVGNLPPRKLTELEAHVARCARCKRYLETTAQSSLEAMPIFWERRKPMVRVMPPEGIRTRFLQRLKQRKGEREETLTPLELQLPLNPIGSREKRDGKRVDSGLRANRFRMSRRPLPLVLGIAATAALFIAGYYAGSRTKRGAISPVRIQAEARIDNRTVHSTPVAPQENLEIVLQSVLADQQRERSRAASERLALEERIAASDAKLTSLQQADGDASQRSFASERETKEALEASRKENEALRRRAAETDAILESQERRTQELQSELEIARNGLQDQDEQRLAKGQLGDLVTARNLHIVDVYDADGGGRRKASFGRVFYVEGKSLLFYAYDLQDMRQAKANVVFHVWGGRAGTKEVTHSLGLLHNEDAKQGLWTMTFDDPAVLAQINSVFVTAESASRRDLVPHGKRVLYAYIGNPPNHP